MTNTPDPFAELATGLIEDHKAAKLKKPSFDATAIGPDAPAKDDRADYVQKFAPTNPKKGESWLRPDEGIKRYWHGTVWRQYRIEDAPPVEVDSAGAAWSADLHAPNKTKNKDGTWRVKSKRKMAREPQSEAPADQPVRVKQKEKPMDNTEEADDIGTDAEVGFDDGAQVEINPRQFIPSIRDALLEQFKHRPKPWSAMSADEQRDCAHTLEDFATNLVRRIVEEVAAGPHHSITCLLESYAEKDGIKVAMKVQAFGEASSDAVLFLHKARGKNVVVRLASIADLKGDAPAQIDPDQTEIDWDAEPVNPHTGDNTDLADAAIDPDDQVENDDEVVIDDGDSLIDDGEDVEDPDDWARG